MTTMTETTASREREAARLAGLREAGEDFRRLAANRANGVSLPADGALRNAWLAAYAARFAELAAPYMTESRLIAAGRMPLFHAGQRIEFISFEDLALGRGGWQAGEVAWYFEPEWQPLPSVSPWLQLTVRVIGRRGGPIGKPIEVSERQVRLPAEVTP